MAKDDKRMKAFGKRLDEMRKSPAASVSKAEEDLTAKATKSTNVPVKKDSKSGGDGSFASAFRAARRDGLEVFPWNGKSYTTQMAVQNKAPAKSSSSDKRSGPSGGLSTAGERTARKNYADVVAKSIAARANAPKPAAGSTAPRMAGAAPAAPAQRNIDRFDLSKVREEMARPAARSRLFAGEDKLKAAQERAAAAQRGYAKGGKVKKFKNAGPVMESKRKPIDMRRAVLGSDKDIVARGNRTPYEPVPKTGPDKPKQKLGRAGAAGYKEGGKVMKKATKFGAAMKNKSADAKGRAMMAKGGKCYAGGGLVAGHKSADGIAKKGKTKGKKC